MSTYDLVEMGKERQGIENDRPFAIRNGLTAQNITDWKSRKDALPSALSLRKLARAAGITMDEALEICTGEKGYQHSLALEQRGFADLGLISGIAGMSLAAVSALPYEAIAVGMCGLGYVYYVKSDGSVVLIPVGELESNLDGLDFEELLNTPPANLAKSAQILAYGFN